MNMATIIVSIICVLLAIVFYITGYFQLRERGILLNNAYLYASQEERQKMNKKPYFRQSGIVFCLVGTIFLLTIIQIITGWKWLSYLFLAITIATVVYALVSTILIETRKSS